MVRKSKVAADQRPCSKAVHPLNEGNDIVGTTQFHVLAVDDSTIDRKLIERLLKNSSYKVTVVDSAVRALEVLGLSEGRSSLNAQAFEFNLIITDYCMPSMTGYDLLKKVKETSALREIPVVIMSSENVRSRIEDCKAEGAEDFILKPVQLEDVKRLRGFIRPSLSRASSLPVMSVGSASGPSACSKRKIAPESVAGRQLPDPERRTRFSSLALV